ncbi:hypothetical protein [Streptomyces sp. NPDC091371]|uniref:hypothetical protein n=1 Tax=Streptomyces sp. NPDC091371 TaxID=3155303 RepID=UPI0034136E5E
MPVSFEAGKPPHHIRRLHEAAGYPLPGNLRVGEHRMQDLLHLVHHRLTHRLPGLGRQSPRRTRK